VPNPYLILAVVIAFVANGFYWNAKGSNSADVRWTAKIQQQRADAEAAARVKEKQLQETADAIITKQDQKLRATQRNLATALDSLRDRPLRPDATSPTTSTAPACGTGAGLCKQDAEFLTREAARADSQRVGLAACYEYIDKVK